LLERGFPGDDPAAFLHARSIASEVIGNPGRRGSQVEPRRTSRHMTVLASVFMTSMRLERMLQS
jgi:hypothetical protein